MQGEEEGKEDGEGEGEVGEGEGREERVSLRYFFLINRNTL